MQFGNIANIIYAPEGNNDDIRDERNDPKKRDNKPGIPDPSILLVSFIYRLKAPYEAMLHSGGREKWIPSEPAVPASGIAMDMRGKYISGNDVREITGLTEAEIRRGRCEN
jgi:hypothetical protein